MRFAYIDSNGNEVPIPSVDALALRIELGAIADDTQLYDAAADQWGPANSHEIYHTLQRSAGDEEGFVAPPPVAPGPVAKAAEEPEPAAEPEGAVDDQDAVEADEPESDLGDISGLTLADAPAEPETADDASGSGALPDLDLSLAEPDAGGLSLEGDGGLDLAPTVDADGPDAAPSEDLGFDSIDLAPAADESDAISLAEVEPVEEGEAPGFDFGAMEGWLELEDAFDDEPAMDFSGGELDTGSPDLGPGGDFGAGGTPSPDFSGGMELETAHEFDSGGFDGGAGGLDLEAPMSDFSPEDPPSWMEDDGGSDEDVLDFSAAASTAEDGDPGSTRERRTPRNKPSPPKHRKQRNLALPLVGVVVLMAIGVGSYTAWPMLSDVIASRGEPDTPPVVIPELAADLMPQMEQAADAALAASFEGIVATWSASDRVDAPGTDWPGGAYMANASEYVVVEDFWMGMSDLLGSARALDLADFDSALAVELSTLGMEEADATAIRERADSGFVAAAPARELILDRFGAVVDASLALHDFVVLNEAGLSHVPASTATTNPVLEVDAATPEISSALDDMLGAVVDALADFGYRDVVSSEGLRRHLLTELQASGIQ
jgi:hypothetical protein